MSEYKKAFDAAKKKAKEDDAATKKNIEGMSDEEVEKELATKKAAKSGGEKKPRVKVTHEEMPKTEAPPKKK
jgi:hypothetical protein